MPEDSGAFTVLRVVALVAFVYQWLGVALVGATPGMLVAGSVAVQAFTAVGWGWGGTWSSVKDYQHVSASGR